MSVIDKIKVLVGKGQFKNAFDKLKHAVKQYPDNTELQVLLGHVLNKLDRPEDGYEILKDIISKSNENGDVYYHLGVSQRMMGNLHKAKDYFEKAVNIDNTHQVAYNDLGLLYLEFGQFDNAEENFRKVIELNPGASGTYSNLAMIYKNSGKINKSIQYLEKSLRITPNVAQTYNNLGNVLSLACRQNESLRAYAKSLKLAPDDLLSYQNYLMSMHYPSEVTKEEIFHQHRKFGKQYTVKKLNTQFDNLVMPERRLRVGYVSPDFRGHAVGFFMKAVVKGHNRMNVLPYLYYNNPTADETTNLFVDMVPSSWRDISSLTKQQVIELIKEDRIDILVDLGGHTSKNRLEIFTDKIAPIQMTYLGYPDTTGLNSIDYRITDKYADPEEAGLYHTEKLLYLPSSFLCYTPPDSIPQVHIREQNSDTIVFGSFNNSSKLSKATIELWAELLSQSEKYKLVLKSLAFRDNEIAESVKAFFYQKGIQPYQISILKFTATIDEHLSLYNMVDIALDTYPYNGTTTTMEALLMGCPVVTLVGDRHSARVGASILNNIGHPELIARDSKEYIDICLYLAKDKEKRRDYKRSLRNTFLDSKLTDKKAFIVDLESEYRNVWRKWCSDQKLESNLVNKHTSEDDFCFSYPAGSFNKEIISLFQKLLSNEVLDSFLKNYLTTGMRVLDIGSGFGGRSLEVAKLVGETGTVYSFEPSSDKIAFLIKNCRENKIDNVLPFEIGLWKFRDSRMLSHYITASLKVRDDKRSDNKILNRLELITLLALDEVVKRYEIEQIDMIYLSLAGGAQKEIIEGATTFLKDESPVVLVEMDYSKDMNSLISSLQYIGGLGYSVFQISPGLNCLTPYVAENTPHYCILSKAAKVNVLRELNLLVQPDQINQSEFDIISQDRRFSGLENKKYFKTLSKLWAETSKNVSQDTAEYYAALDLFVSSQDESLSLDDRWGCLSYGYRKLKIVCEHSPQLSRLFSLARIAIDIGDMHYVKGVLQILFELFQTPDQIVLDEMHLALLKRYEDIDPGKNIGGWCVASILEAMLHVHMFEDCSEQGAAEQISSMIGVIQECGMGDESFTQIKNLIENNIETS